MTQRCTRLPSSSFAFALLFCGFACLLNLACQSEDQAERARAEIGVFYGGQLQRLTRMDISRTQLPKLGFRVDFVAGQDTESISRDAPKRMVSYEVVRPGPAGRRVTRRRELEIPVNQLRLDHLIRIEDGDRLGVWNIRVVHDGKILADRAVYLERGR